MTNFSPPKPDEIEISIFGPGYGECILIHTGDNEWIVIDSCIEPSQEKPAALNYLSNIGQDPNDTVRLVVATHWHDDHVRGLGDLFDLCKNADFVCSDALRCKEFLTLTASNNRVPAGGTTYGVTEFNKVIKSLEERTNSSGRQHTPIWAVADRPVWRRNAANSISDIPCTVFSLSPSDLAKTLAYKDISRLLPIEESTQGNIISHSPNHTSVVLWITIAQIHLLLGADLEETSQPGLGWSAIIDSAAKPAGKASLFKVPHHGSPNADNPEVWNSLLISNPTAVVTPHIHGSTKLPGEKDIERIKSKSDRAYLTALPTVKRRKRKKIVEQFVRGAVKSIRLANPSYGHVRVRANLGSDPVTWRYELFGDAVSLADIK